MMADRESKASWHSGVRLLALAAALVAMAGPARGQEEPTPRAPLTRERRSTADALALPTRLGFETNCDQAPDGVAFVARTREYTAYLDGDGARIRLSAPVAWQNGLLGREPVEVRYDLRGDGRVGFVCGPHDVDRPLRIDPEINALTYLGTEADEEREPARVLLDSDVRPIVVWSTREPGARRPSSTRRSPSRCPRRAASSSRAGPAAMTSR